MSLSLSSNSIIATQALTNNFGTANRQMVNIGGILYYITKREITLFNGDAFLLIYKSDSTGLIWTLDASIGGGGGPGTLSEFGIAVVGTKIYIVDRKPSSPNWFLGMWVYDTLTGALTGPATNNGPQTNNDTAPITLSPTNAGNVIATYTKSGTGSGTFAVLYTPGTDTWGTPVSVNALAGQVVAQIHDATTDKTVVFYNNGGTKNLIASVLDATPTILNTTASIFTFFSFKFNGTWGQPTITSDSPSGGSSVALPFLSDFTTLSMVFIDLATYAVTLETIEDGTDLPAGVQVQVYGNQDQEGSAAFDFGGTLYTVFATDNGALNNTSSQCWLYAKARTGGVWTGLQILFTSVLSREMLAPFPATWTTDGPAIMVNLWDPTKNIDTDLTADGLTSFILLPAAAPAPPTPGVLANTQNTVQTRAGIKQRLITIPPMSTFDDVRKVMAKSLADLQTHISTQLPITNQLGKRLSNVGSPVAADDAVTLRYLQGNLQTNSPVPSGVNQGGGGASGVGGAGSGPGSGSVTSVAITVPAEFTITGSPITTNGIFAVTKATETANTVWAGPTSGGAATPTFRTLVAADLPLNFADNEVPSGTINGTNVTFTVAHTVNPAASLKLFLNNSFERQGTDYTLSGATITFSVAPPLGQTLLAFYRY